MGPVVSDTHQKKVLGYIDKGESEGAKLVVDGRKLRVPGYDAGYYVGGTLFDHVTPEMTIWREEIFGPVLGIVRAADYDSALEAGQQPRVWQRQRRFHQQRPHRA